MPENSMPCALLDSAAIKKVAPVSDMTLWRWIKEGSFPPPFKIGRRNFWRADEIEAWIGGLSAKRQTRLDALTERAA